MTHQSIRTPHGDYEIIQTARGFFLRDQFGNEVGMFRDEAEAVAALQARLVG